MGRTLAQLIGPQHQVPSAKTIQAGLSALGKKGFRSGQLEIVMAALQGKSILVVSPTGSGKSLCFQLPAILKPGYSLVISPLKALMSDQVANLLKLHIPVTLMNSDITDQDERQLRYELLHQSAIKLFYCTPERFGDKVSEEERNRLNAYPPTYMIIDEAHVVSSWGRGFRPDYGNLKQVRERLGNPPILAFTATANPETQKRIKNMLGIPDATSFLRDVDRPNITLIKREAQTIEDKVKIIRETASNSQFRNGKTVIFVPSKNAGEAAQAEFKKLGLDIPFYHANIPAKEKDFILGRLTGRIDPPLQMVICTNAFGMGVDISDIRLVFHWQIPGSLEDYVQEFGRAGRDGKESQAVLFISNLTKEAKTRRLMNNSSLNEANLPPTVKKTEANRKEKELNLMQQYAVQNTGCLRQTIRDYFQSDKSQQSWSLRILNSLFTKDKKRRQRIPCCSLCNPNVLDPKNKFPELVMRIMQGIANLYQMG